jgi:cysteine desulfuration protein SufE
MGELPGREKLLNNFNRCKNWEQKYIYIIKLGEKIPWSPIEIRCKENLIPGCQSRVWIDISVEKDGKVVIDGDSDAAIVRGLIAMVITLYSNLNISDIISYNIYEVLEKLGLARHLTPSRSQGIDAMIRNIRSQVRDSLVYQKN